MQVIWNRLYNTKSSMDHCTLYQLRDLINRRNVVTEVKKDVNACEDFFVNCQVSHSSGSNEIS